MTLTDWITIIIVSIAWFCIGWSSWKTNQRVMRAERKCDILLQIMEQKDRMDELQKQRLDRIQQFLTEIRKLLQHYKT